MQQLLVLAHHQSLPRAVKVSSTPVLNLLLERTPNRRPECRPLPRGLDHRSAHRRASSCHRTRGSWSSLRVTYRLGDNRAQSAGPRWT